MESMKLGKFRELTKELPDSAEITISIRRTDYVHPMARYKINGFSFVRNDCTLNYPLEICLTNTFDNNK